MASEGHQREDIRHVFSELPDPLSLSLSAEDQEEKDRILQSAECCRKILNHVNDEVKVMENLLVRNPGDPAVGRPSQQGFTGLSAIVNYRIRFLILSTLKITSF